MSEGGYESIILRGVETRSLDYKGPMAWDARDPDCIALVADVIGMANTGGGHLVIGVSEDSSAPGGWRYDGVSGEQLVSWDQTKVGEVVRNYAAPPPDLVVARVPRNGVTVIVIAVQAFRRQPHICIRSYEKPGVKGGAGIVLRKHAVYIRSGAAQTQELQDADQFQDLIELAIRQRREDMLSAVDAILKGADLRRAPIADEKFTEQSKALEAFGDGRDGIDLSGCFIDTFHPAEFRQDRFRLSSLKKAVKNGVRDFKSGPFIHSARGDQRIAIRNDGIQFFAKWFTMEGGDHFDCWDFKANGTLLAIRRFWEEGRWRGHKGAWEESRGRPYEGVPYLDPDSVIWRVAAGVDTLVAVYSALGVQSEEVTWKMRLTGTEGRGLGTPNSLFMGPDRFAMDDPITWERTAAVEEWAAARIEIGAEACQHIFERFNWTTVPVGTIRDRVREVYDGKR